LGHLWVTVNKRVNKSQKIEIEDVKV